MLQDNDDAPAAAAAAAKWFSEFTEFKSHGRRVSRDEARAQGIKVVDLEADDAFQDAVLSVHHAVAHTLAGTPTVKLIENQHGRAFIQMNQQVFVPVGPGNPPSAPQVQQPPTPNRATRRGGKRRR